MRKMFVLLVVPVVSLIIWGSPAIGAQPLVPRLLLIVAGQSNATGLMSFAVDPTTGVNYFAPPYTNGADAVDTISLLTGTYEPPIINAALDTPQQIPDWPVFFGPEIGLARTLYSDTGQAVSIVKATFPGTSLKRNWRFVPGAMGAQMVGLVHKTMVVDARAGYADTIGAFYWYQGESDAYYLPWAMDYQTNLASFISDVRAHLPMSSTTPIVLVKESQDVGSPGDTLVRAADDWAAANLPNVTTVDTSGLPRIGIHLTNASELELGAQMAGRCSQLLGQ